MTNANDLSRIAMSANLAATLTRASAFAGEWSHAEVTLEHLLLALLDDPDATPVLSTSNVDTGRIAADIKAYLGRLPLAPAGGSSDNLSISQELKRILSAAAAAAQQGRRSEISGAIVLAAVIGDGQSAAAQVLRAQGLTFDAAIRALQQAASATPAAVPSPPGPSGEQAAVPARFGQRAAPPQSAGSLNAIPPVDVSHPAAVTNSILANARERVLSRSGPSASHPVPSSGGDQGQVGPIALEDQHDRANSAQPAPDLPPQRAPRIEPHFDADATGQDAMPRIFQQAPEQGRQPSGYRGVPQPDHGFSSMPGSESLAPGPLRPGGAPAPNLDLANNPSTADERPESRPQPQQRPELAMQRATPSRVEARATPNRRRPATGIEAGQLAHNIPRHMRTATPRVVEARIAKANVRALAEGLQSGGAYRHEIMVTKAMSVRLRAPHGGFYIEPGSPETQWIENTFGLLTDEFANWRWQVTPKARGRRRLQLVVSARTVGADGLAAETALPDQVIDVRVGANYAATARAVGIWLVAGACGAALALFGESLYAGSAKVVAKLIGS